MKGAAISEKSNAKITRLGVRDNNFKAKFAFLEDVTSSLIKLVVYRGLDFFQWRPNSDAFNPVLAYIQSASSNRFRSCLTATNFTLF